MILDPSNPTNTNAAALVKLVGYAYAVQDEEPTDQLLDTANFFYNNYVDGLVLNHNNQLIIAFCGTDDLNDWLTNIDVGQAPGHCGYVHSGFFAAEKSIIKTIIKWIKEDNPSWIWLTGHSAGGAVAILLADSLSKKYPNLSVYTFGAPKVCNKLAAKNYKAMAYQYFNEFDPIPLLPPNIPFYYKHVGQITTLRGKTNILSRMKQTIIRILNWCMRRRDTTLIETIQEHNIKTYSERLGI